MATSSEAHVDDCVDYCLFPNIDAVKYSKEELIVKLRKTLEDILVELSPLLVDYIWQSEHFMLNPATRDDDYPPFLHGSTHFGNNIEDEWFIVFLLLKLTKQFEGLLAKVSDNDGEFLLIEGAGSLPKWLNPDTSKNRVYLYQGDLHIIPLPSTPAELAWLPQGTPTVRQASSIIRHHPDRTIANTAVRNAIHRRLQCYPDRIYKHIHRTNCYLPARAASVLQHSPGLVAAAIQAFCHRDPIDMKACRFMKYFPPKDFVLSQVKFTRCLYAELVHHNFQPPVRSEWRLPPPSNPKHKSSDLGVKLSYGLEILCSRCRNPPETKSSLEVTKSSPENTIWNSCHWQRYLESLKQKGYFRGEIQGSILYTSLLNSARKFYIETVNEDTRNISDPGYKILEILQTTPTNLEKLQQMQKDLPADDDESWLTLTADELDKMIETASGRLLRNPSVSADEEEPASSETNFNPSLLTDTMKSFVSKVSSYEGAEFPKASDSAPISFDADSFDQVVKNLLEYRAPVEEDEDSDDFLSSADEDDDDAIANKADDKIETEVEEIREMMKAMDHELDSTAMGETFEKEPKSVNPGTEEDESDDLRPVEIDLNLLKNLLESYSSQNGLAGPASNILHSMGIKLPQNSDE